MGKELLFEIGCEEIPSAYMTGMLAALKERAEASFKEARLDFEGLTVMGTPRRLVLHVADLAEQQSPLKEEIFGPPVKNAFDDDGNPNKAALGFAKTSGVEVSQLQRVDTPKGERLMFLMEDEGEEVGSILSARVLYPLIRNLPSPKSMRWGSGRVPFVRPIHWVLALYGGKIVPEIKREGIASLLNFPYFNNSTFGHRFMAPEGFTVTGFDDYLMKLRAHKVEPVVDDGAGGGRIPLVRRGVEEAAAGAGAELAADVDGVERLVEKVAHLVEWPIPVTCSFEERFLDLPEEVIISTLETHQRCFALRKKGGGALVAKFIGVSNTEAKDMKVVGQGYARVVRARLEDAEFYWKQDLETPLDDMAEKLKGVVYHPRLGTSWEKTERFRALAKWITAELFPGEKELVQQVDKAARLCKADLTSGMVYEFPELQGLMGSRYAERAGVEAEVSNAIFEHYLPRGEGDDLPSGDVGAIVGLADRMDTLAGMIGLGYVPSGSEDPYALRRAANGINRVLIALGCRISLNKFAIQAMVPLLDKFKDDKETVTSRLADFLRNRVGASLARGRGRADLIEAVISAGGGTGWHAPADAAARLAAVEKLAASADTFEPLATTFKRVSNIIRQAAGEGGGNGDNFSEELLEDEGERILNDVLGVRSTEIEKIMASLGDIKRDENNALENAWAKVMENVTALRPAVDKFFDEVLVMAEDEKLRRNRLALLGRVGALFEPVADFSKIQGRPKE
ncbi:MAG: glycine--tRNA ligase subunit beta [Nitrospinaceae bacterium]|nr:glycine--tRNA ligase subunit beta [Nitrospinaceae bacterium]